MPPNLLCFISDNDQQQNLQTNAPTMVQHRPGITAELLAGARALSLADRHHFGLNLSDLLDKSTQCKRNWLLNVIAARQRFERQQANFEGIQTLSIANSKLIKWMTTGRASHCSPSTSSLPMPQLLGAS